MEGVRRKFGRAVRKRREKLGTSQEEFAGLCGLHRTYMGGIERGERNVSLVNLERIARGFKTTLSDSRRSAANVQVVMSQIAEFFHNINTPCPQAPKPSR